MKKIEVDLEKFVEVINTGLTTRQVAEEMGMSYALVRMTMTRNGLKSKYIRSHDEETKRKMSESRKLWLAENPEKHPWRRKDKFKSEPCEKAREFLKKLGVSFVGEFIPDIDGRSFSIDIAIPDKMIALEVNGNQHYKRNGDLKPYYQERHDLLAKAGWTVYEIHYSACFKFDKWKEFAAKINSSEPKVEFDYFNYVPRENLGAKNKCKCGHLKYRQSVSCRRCNDKIARKTKRRPDRPSKEKMEKLILKYPFATLGKMYGVSGTAVRKWCIQDGITKFPDNKFRQEQFHKKKSK